MISRWCRGSVDDDDVEDHDNGDENCEVENDAKFDADANSSLGVHSSVEEGAREDETARRIGGRDDNIIIS
jgi:hypothetical protein